MTNNELAKQNINPEVKFELGTYEFVNKSSIEAILLGAEKYKGILIVADDDVKFVRNTRKQLNDIVKEIDRKRIDTKNEMSKPIKEMEREFNDLKAIVLETHQDLDSTYKAYEQRLKDEKQAEIDKLIDELSDGIEIEPNTKWLNKGYKIDDIEKEIVEQVEAYKEAVELKEKHIQMIKTTSETNGLTPDGYIQVLETGMDVLDIIDSITKAGEAKRQKEAELAEQARLQEEYNAEMERIRKAETETPKEPEPTKEEVIDQAVYETEQEIEVDHDETGELVYRVAEFRATLSQLKAIDEFAASIGVEMLPHACQATQN